MGTGVAGTESEPNDAIATANDCRNGSPITGVVSPVAPVDITDFFLIGNSTKFPVQVNATLAVNALNFDDDNLDLFLIGGTGPVLALSNLPVSNDDVISFTVPKGTGPIYLFVVGIAFDLDAGDPLGTDTLARYSLSFTATSTDAAKPRVRFIGPPRLRNNRTRVKAVCRDDNCLKKITFRAPGGHRKTVSVNGRKRKRVTFIYQGTRKNVRMKIMAIDTTGNVGIGKKRYAAR